MSKRQAPNTNTQSNAIAHGDSQRTYGKLADGFGEAAAGFVSSHTEFAIAPQVASGEPFDFSALPPASGVTVPINKYITEAERKEYREEMAMYERAKQMGNLTVDHY